MTSERSGKRVLGMELVLRVGWVFAAAPPCFTICISGNIMLYPPRTILATRNGNKEVPEAFPARLWLIRGKDML